MKKRFKRLMALGIAVSMAAALTACGGSSGQTSTDQTSTAAQQEAAGNADPQAKETPAAGTAAADTFSLDQPEGWTEADATEKVVYQTNSAINTLCKWSQSAGDTTFMVDYLLFDGLLNKDTEGNTIPWLAESWEMAEDNSKITFHLRDDVYFTNGEKLTADDVIFTFETIRDDIEHLPDSTAKGWRKYIGELEKIDDLSFTLNFSAPMPEFWVMANIPDLQIICKSAYEGTSWEDFWKNPVGTGAYVVTSFDGANSVVELELRSDEHGYWAYDAMNRYTNVKNITFQYSPEATTRVSSLRTGEADIIANVPSADVESLKAEGYTVETLYPATYVFLQTACAEGDILSNRDLREALSLCIDRPLIVQALLDGYGIPCDYPCLNYDLGYRDTIKYEYDVEKAKELVAGSGYNGESIRFIYSASTVPIATELCQAIQSMATSIGLNVEVVPLEVAVYDEARNNHDFDLCLASISKSGNMWFKTASEVIGADRFHTGLDNEELMSLGKQVGSEMNMEKQDDLLAQMYQIELTEFEPNLYLYWPTNLYARKNNVHGITFHAFKNGDYSMMVVEK